MKPLDIQLLIGDIALIIVLARLLGILARRLGQPAVLGEILIGILLGPTFFNGKLTATLFPPTVINPLTALADLGLVLFMFVVGYELDMRLVRGRERVAASVSLGNVLLPLGFGALLGIWLAHRNNIAHVGNFSLFIGTALAATAFPVLARILTDRGLHRTRIGGLALAAAAITDVLAWSLLAVCAAIAAGKSGTEYRIALVPIYVLVMIFLVRPFLKWVAGYYLKAGRLTPTILAVVLTTLLLSCYATTWMGLHFIFGAFMMGVVMPRVDTGALREDILQRLEQISVLVLLPIYFVISGLSINLSTIGTSGLVDLIVILVVAIGSKYGGAYIGARSAGIRGRDASILATLMNTRGLTEIVILGVGLQLGILTKPLYGLMVVMALITTAMSGPLLRVLYPDRAMQRDITAADRQALGTGPAHRVVVVIDDPDTAEPLVNIGADLTVGRPGSELVLAHLMSYRAGARLEVGGGIGGELVQMTEVTTRLHDLVEHAGARGAHAVVLTRFSENVTRDLPGYIAAAEPDTVVVAVGSAGEAAARADDTLRVVTMRLPVPDHPSAVAVCFGHSAHGVAALHAAAEIASARDLEVIIVGGDRRRARSAVNDLLKRGVRASDGALPDGSELLAGDDEVSEFAEQAQLSVRAGSGPELSDAADVARPSAAVETGGQP